MQMPSVAIGAIAAVVASALFSAGLVLQAVESRQVDPRHSLHLSLIGSLMCRPRFLLGTALTLVGFGFHVTALLLAPLTVVQPALSAGLLVLLVIAARTPDQEVGALEVGAVIAIAAGVVGVTLTAPERVPLEGERAALVAALAVLAGCTLVPYALARLGASRARSVGALTTFGAGAAYAFSGLTTNLASDKLARQQWGLTPSASRAAPLPSIEWGAPSARPAPSATACACGWSRSGCPRFAAGWLQMYDRRRSCMAGFHLPSQS